MIRLAVLGIEYELGLNRVFHDDGFVEDVLAHRRKLDGLYGCLGDEKIYQGQKFSGEHAFRKEWLPNGAVVVHNHIYYVNHGFSPSNINTRGHEETHAAEFDGVLHLLAERILEEQGVRIDFRAIDEKEVGAEIGGIFALYRWGFYPELLINRPERPVESYFDAARKLYEQSRIPRKTIFVPGKPAIALEQKLNF